MDWSSSGQRAVPFPSANFGADVWRPAVTSVGLKGFTFHGLRGVSATLAARQGATTKELRRRHATTWLCVISEPTPSDTGSGASPSDERRALWP